MTKSLIALTFACVCGMLAVAVPGIAQSQSVTIQGCANPTFNTQTLVLSCGSGGTSAPVCSWPTTPPSTYTNGNTLTLAPSCSGSPTSYAWTVTGGSIGSGGSCASGATCTDKHAIGFVGTLTYSVIATNGNGSSNPISATVAWADGVGAPTGCTVTPSTQSMGSSGGAIAPLTVSCSGGAPLTSWSWARSGNCGGTTAMGSLPTQGDSIPANTGTSSLSCTYTATVGNGSGTAAPTATVTVAGKTTAIDCKSSPQGAALGITGSTTTYNVPWVTDSGNTDYTGNGTLPPQRAGMAFVGVIKVPAGAPTGANIGRIDTHEYIDTTHNRLVTVSQTPCSWGMQGDGVTFTQYGTNPNFYFTVGPNSGGYVPMLPGSTWYVNIVMQNPLKVPPQGNQCGTTTCNFVVEFFKPNGT